MVRYLSALALFPCYRAPSEKFSGVDMTERRRGFMARLAPWLIVFVLGVTTGFYVRDQQQHKLIQEAADNARRELESVGLEAIERAREAGAGLSSGAEAVAESTKAAFRRLVGGSETR